jgi:hypothetical protein
LKIVLILCVVVFAGCARLQPDDAPVKMVAEAGSEKLSAADLAASVPVAGGDSAFVVKRTIEKWAEDALFFQEAVEKLDQFQTNVDQEVETYRRDLINHIYSSRLINANLDTVITAEETEAYYNEHRSSFILKENIVKVYYLKVPVRSPALTRIKKLKGTAIPKEQQELRQLCLQNAESFFINDSTWLFLEEIKREIPVLKEEPDMAMSMGRVVEFSDEFYYYYLRIKDVKIKNSLSPLNFERSNIRKFILNTRKAQLIRDYKKQVLEKAKASKAFVIY